MGEQSPGSDPLARLLSGLRPRLVPGVFVFTHTAGPAPDCRPLVMVREDEGLTLVLEQAEADRLGLAYDQPQALITLGVQSSLSAVGLTAAVATALAAHGVSCNVVAGFFHDHLFVPQERESEALDVLARLSRSTGRG